MENKYSRLYLESELPKDAEKLYLCRFAARDVACPEMKNSRCSYPDCSRTTNPANARDFRGPERLFRRLEGTAHGYYEVER